MADALGETKPKSNKFKDLYDEYNIKITTLEAEIKKIKQQYAGNQADIEYHLRVLSQTKYNNVPLDRVYNDLLTKQNYIVNALTSPYIKTRAHRTAETASLLATFIGSAGLIGTTEAYSDMTEGNPLRSTDAENQSGISMGFGDWWSRNYFPHVAPQFSHSDGNGLYKPNEFYDTEIISTLKDESGTTGDGNEYLMFHKDQDVDAWGRDYDHEFFGIAPENIVDSASDETIINTLNGDNLNKNTVVTPPPIGGKDGGKSTEVINSNTKKGGDSQVTTDTTYKGVVAASTTIDDSESENTIPKRVQLMSSSIKENPSRIQEGLMEDPRWSPDRLAKLRIKDQDFQKAKKNKDLMIAFNKNKASGVYS